jgi:hypothetical protein
VGPIVAFAWLERLGFAGWFGVLGWFGFLGAPAIFRAGIDSALAVLFPPMFWFGVGCGAAAMVGSLGSPRDMRRGWRLALAVVVLAGTLVEALVIDPLVHHSVPGSSGFAAAHAASTTIATVAWLAAAVGLLAG